MTLYKIDSWDDHFEGSKSRNYKNKTSCQLPTKHGLGYRRLVRSENGAALFGAWCALIQVLSRHKSPRLGYVTEDGTADGLPLTPDDLEMLTDISADIFESMFEQCTSNRISWIFEAKSPVKVPQYPEKVLESPIVSPYYPLNSDLDLDLDSDSDNKAAPESLKLLGKVFIEVFRKVAPNLSEHTRILRMFDDESANKALQWFIDNPDERQFYPIANARKFEDALARLIDKSGSDSNVSDDVMSPIYGMPNGATLR